MSETTVIRRSTCCSPRGCKKDFKEQKLPAWQPLYSSGSVSLCFFIVAVFFLVFGSVILVEDQTVVEVTEDYTTCNDCQLTAYNESCSCEMTIEVDEKIPAPVYVQYQLDGFFQNHRRLLEYYFISAENVFSNVTPRFNAKFRKIVLLLLASADSPRSSNPLSFFAKFNFENSLNKLFE